MGRSSAANRRCVKQWCADCCSNINTIHCTIASHKPKLGDASTATMSVQVSQPNQHYARQLPATYGDRIINRELHDKETEVASLRKQQSRMVNVKWIEEVIDDLHLSTAPGDSTVSRMTRPPSQWHAMHLNFPSSFLRPTQPFSSSALSRRVMRSGGWMPNSRRLKERRYGPSHRKPLQLRSTPPPSSGNSPSRALTSHTRLHSPLLHHHLLLQASVL